MKSDSKATSLFRIEYSQLTAIDYEQKDEQP